MCFDPVTLAALAASAALSAGGAAITHDQTQKGARKEVEARNRELQQFRGRQKEAEERNRAVLNDTIRKFAPEAQTESQEGAVERRNAAIEATITPDQDAYAADVEGGESTPMLRKDAARSLRDVFLNVTNRAKLQAKAMSYGDTVQNNNLNLIEGARPIETQNAFTRQEASMLPSMQDMAAYAAKKPPSALGPIMQALGSAAGMFAGSGYLRAPAAAAAPTALHLMPTSL